MFCLKVPGAERGAVGPWTGPVWREEGGCLYCEFVSFVECSSTFPSPKTVRESDDGVGREDVWTDDLATREGWGAERIRRIEEAVGLREGGGGLEASSEEDSEP